MAKLPLKEQQFQHTATRRWLRRFATKTIYGNGGFNTQPPEGGCRQVTLDRAVEITVSTHSHPKVAACAARLSINQHTVSTHSHPKVAAS